MNDAMLSAEEIGYSLKATQKLGYRALVYNDDKWICEPDYPKLNGYGSTVDEAIEDCKQRNSTS